MEARMDQLLAAVETMRTEFAELRQEVRGRDTLQRPYADNLQVQAPRSVLTMASASAAPADTYVADPMAAESDSFKRLAA